MTKYRNLTSHLASLEAHVSRCTLSFQKIDYPPWDMYFCHDYSYEFPLMDYVCDTFDLETELDCVLFMQNTRQTWGTSWLYRE